MSAVDNTKIKDASTLAADSLLQTSSFVSIYCELKDESRRKDEMEFLF